MKHKVVPFEVKSAAKTGESGEGYASCFHMLDAVNEIVVPGAFRESLPEFLASGFVGGLNHRWDEPCGVPTSAVEDARGLKVAWKLSTTAHAMDVRALLRDGVVKKLSIGYAVAASETLNSLDEVKAYWKKHGYQPSSQELNRAEGGARLLRKIQPLYEFSPVTVPACAGADITSVKDFAGDPCGSQSWAHTPTVSQFSDWLRKECGLSRTESTRFVAVVKERVRQDSEIDREAQGHLNRYEQYLKLQAGTYGRLCGDIEDARRKEQAASIHPSAEAFKKHGATFLRLAGEEDEQRHLAHVVSLKSQGKLAEAEYVRLMREEHLKELKERRGPYQYQGPLVR